MHNSIYYTRIKKSISHKQGIARSFSRAAQHYDHYAIFQRACGDYLCDFIGSVKWQHLLDAGCGTGWFSRRWQGKIHLVIAMDISDIMLSLAYQQQSADAYLLGDIEHLPLATKSIDGIFSNLAVQWCYSLPQALAEMYRVLKPGGVLALSTLALGSLVELEQAWRLVDKSVHINKFLSEIEIARAFAPYRHRLLNKIYHLYYPNIIDLLRTIKGVGAGYLYNRRHPSLTSRSRLQALETNWPYHQKGLLLSYRVVYGVIYRD